MAASPGRTEAFINAGGHLCHDPLAADGHHRLVHPRWARPDLPDRAVRRCDRRDQRLPGPRRRSVSITPTSAQTGAGRLELPGRIDCGGAFYRDACCFCPKPLVNLLEQTEKQTLTVQTTEGEALV